MEESGWVPLVAESEKLSYYVHVLTNHTLLTTTTRSRCALVAICSSLFLNALFC